MSEKDRGIPGARRLGDLAGTVADAVVQNLDLDAAIRGVDVDDVLDRVDVNRLLDRVDVDRLLDHVDVDRLLDQVDVNRLLDRVDVDRLLDRADVDRLVARAGIADIVAESTGRVAGSALDGVRRQVVGLDVIAMQVLLRVTGRDPAQRPAGPGMPARAGGRRLPQQGSLGAPIEMTGRYAGLLVRVLALAGDIGIATSAFTLLVALLGWTATTVLGIAVADLPASRGPAYLAGLVVWWLLYWTGTLSVQARTPAMGILGLRLVAADGGPLKTRRMVRWVLALPVSAGVFGVGYVAMLLGREPRTLHDRIAGAAVVYDWGAVRRGAPSPLTRWIEAHEDDAPAAPRTPAV